MVDLVSGFGWVGKVWVGCECRLVSGFAWVSKVWVGLSVDWLVVLGE